MRMYLKNMYSHLLVMLGIIRFYFCQIMCCNGAKEINSEVRYDGMLSINPSFEPPMEPH